MPRIVFACGSVLAGLGVVLGAFAVHALGDRLGAARLATFETGVRYQVVHALALLALALAMDRWPDRGLLPAALLMVIGVILFSGSLELLAVTGVRWLGALAPVGGGFLIIGWGVTAFRLLVRGG